MAIVDRATFTKDALKKPLVKNVKNIKNRKIGKLLEGLSLLMNEGDYFIIGTTGHRSLIYSKCSLTNAGIGLAAVLYENKELLPMFKFAIHYCEMHTALDEYKKPEAEKPEEEMRRVGVV